MFAKHILIALKWGVCVCVCVFLQGSPGDQLSLQLFTKILVKTYLHIHFTVILNSLPKLKFSLQVF